MGRGRSKTGHIEPYGTEFHRIFTAGKIMFVRPNEGATTAPGYTKTKGRIYVTVGKDNNLKYITRYGTTKKALNGGYNRSRQIDLRGQPHVIDGEKVLPHTHLGYKHDEHGTVKLTKADRRLIEKVKREWYNHTSGQ